VNLLTALAFCGILSFIAAVAILGSWLADEIERSERDTHHLPRARANGTVRLRSRRTLDNCPDRVDTLPAKKHNKK